MRPRTDRLLDVQRDRGFREGSGAAGGIAGALTLFFAAVPFVLVVVLYLFFTVVTMAHGTDLRSETVNVPLMLAGVSVITGILVTLLLVAVSIAGGSLTPKKRRRDRD